jgi:hypothetical protein
MGLLYANAYIKNNIGIVAVADFIVEGGPSITAHA